MSDLLNTLGKKSNSVEGAGKASEPQPTSGSTSASTAEHGRGDDLLSKLGGKESHSKAESTVTSSAESGQPQKSASSTEEPTGGQTDDWTKDSALKEVKKLREENKAYRLKYQQEVEKLNAEANAVLNQPEVKERFTKQGIDAEGGTPEQLRAHVKSEIVRYDKLIKSIGLKSLM